MTYNANFLLANNEGCIMHEVVTTSFKKAREEFKQFYCGEFKIIWYAESGKLQTKKVRL